MDGLSGNARGFFRELFSPLVRVGRVGPVEGITARQIATVHADNPAVVIAAVDELLAQDLIARHGNQDYVLTINGHQQMMDMVREDYAGGLPGR